MTFLQKIWAFLSGNKTWIGSTGLLILKAEELMFIWSRMNQDWYGVLCWVFGLMLLVGGIHKAGKLISKVKTK